MNLSPAKINLGLKILSKRSDGYHSIESIFIKLDFGDLIEVLTTPGSDSQFILQSKNDLNGRRRHLFESVSERGDLTKNIFWKVYVKLQPYFLEPLHIHVNLEKRIPPEGGIGGGSSNAGSLIKSLLPLCRKEAKTLLWHEIVGADVPFFLQDNHAFVTGIGEILEPIPLAKGWGVLAVPEISLPTAEMFQSLQKDLQETPPSRPWKSLGDEVVGSLQTGDWKGLRGHLKNDFEEIACRNEPSLLAIRDSFLDLEVDFASLSGSGSCLYGLVSSYERSQSLKAKMQSIFPDLAFHSFSF